MQHQVLDADGIGIGEKCQFPMFNITINNYGTISGSDDSIKMLNSSNTGINIVTKGEGTYVGEIELNRFIYNNDIRLQYFKRSKNRNS